jgi:hypothetical protein
MHSQFKSGEEMRIPQKFERIFKSKAISGRSNSLKQTLRK